MLPTLDLNTTTERQIREMLAQQHGFAVDTPATKKIVKVAHANLAEVE
jgi:carbamoylphosphate synthase small subunit